MPTSFAVYGPKVLACIAGLPATLASRAITIRMFRSGADSDKPRRRLDQDPAMWNDLRDDLYAIALEYGPLWQELAAKSDVCPAAIAGRAYELWQPILALAWWVESHGAAGLHGVLQRYALASTTDGADDATPEADEALLTILAEAVIMGVRITPKEILLKALERDQAAFDRWSSPGVRYRLKQYGFTTKKSGGRREYRDATIAQLRKVELVYRMELGLPGIPVPPAAGLSQLSQVSPPGAKPASV